MYLKTRIALISTVFASSMAMPVLAADLDPMPIIAAPMPVAPEVQTVETGGWYLRGDVGYSLNRLVDGEVIYNTASAQGMGQGTLRGEVEDSFLIGGGIGYDTGNMFRADLTADYNFESDFSGSSTGFCTPTGGGAAVSCSTSDVATYSALTLMANAYVDLGTVNGVTPYVGAGIGGAHVTWGTLSNTTPDGFVTSGTETHTGGEEWRFAYAVMAGASVDITHNLKLDAGYRYRRITGGKMFEIGDGLNGANSFTGPGHDKGITSHDFRIGARYSLGGGSSASQAAVSEPYNPVYK